MKKILLIILFLTGLSPVFKNNSINLNCGFVYAQEPKGGEETVYICKDSKVTTEQQGDWLVEYTCTLENEDGVATNDCVNICEETGCTWSPLGDPCDDPFNTDPECDEEDEDGCTTQCPPGEVLTTNCNCEPEGCTITCGEGFRVTPDCGCEEIPPPPPPSNCRVICPTGYSEVNCVCVKNTTPTPKPDPCAEAVRQAFNDLIQQGNLAKILGKFIGPNAQYQIKINMGPIENGNLAHTNKFNITFNQDYPNATIASKTATLIHEYIHAYFNTLEAEYKITNNPHIYDDYPYLKAAFVDKTTDAEIAHHDQIAASFIGTMVDVLKELQPDISIAGNPDQFYTDMVWGTLQGTPAYNNSNLSPLSSDDKFRIGHRRIIERDNAPFGANSPMGTPCNN